MTQLHTGASLGSKANTASMTRLHLTPESQLLTVRNYRVANGEKNARLAEADFIVIGKVGSSTKAHKQLCVTMIMHCSL